MKDLNQLKEEKKELFKKRNELQRQIKEHSVTAVEETKIKNDINHLNQEIDKINNEIKSIKSLKIQNFDLNAEEEMEEVLELIRNGKSWKRAADLANVPLSKIEYWYDEGKNGNGQKNIDFYNSILEIEDEISQTISNQNEIDAENIKMEREETRMVLAQMSEIVKLMKSGVSRHEAAQNVGVSTFLVDLWVDNGKNKRDRVYVSFYNKIKDLEFDDENQGTEVKCPNCGKMISEDADKCPFCGRLKLSFCPNCGGRITEDELSFCPNCGNSLIDIS